MRRGIAVAFAVAACGWSGTGDAQADDPPPYQGADELELGAYHTFGDAHRVTIRQVAQRQAGAGRHEGTVGLAAEVEACAGDGELQPYELAIRLFQDIPFDMQGTVVVMHGWSGASNVGLREPLLITAGALGPGECARGWVDYLNIYGDHGDPTRLGFQIDPGSDDFEAVWPATEE